MSPMLAIRLNFPDGARMPISTFGWERIMAVTVPTLNLAVLLVDQQLGMLVLGNFPRAFYGCWR